MNYKRAESILSYDLVQILINHQSITSILLGSRLYPGFAPETAESELPIIALKEMPGNPM
jgi:hypothetical protein